MRRRFSLFLITCIASIIAVLMLLLSLFGVLNPADSQLEYSLTQQLDYSFNQISSNMDQLAAHAVEFSQEMTKKINAEGISFSHFRNNPEALTNLQCNTYETVLKHMRLADLQWRVFYSEHNSK